MIITLSPAKLQDFDTPATIQESTIPQFMDDAEYLNGLMRGLTADDIKQLMSISPKMALEVYQYIQSFDLPRVLKKQAALAYNGIAYQGLQAETFSQTDWEFAQKHLVHMSGMYGALRPMDLIKPYRLEAVIKLANDKGRNLYDYWTTILTQYLSERLRADDNVWINLSSKEYTKLIDRKTLAKEVKVITPIFKQQTASGYKQIVVYAKKARGMMSRFIIENKLLNVDELKHFDVEGYSFAPELSGSEEWAFVR